MDTHVLEGGCLCGASRYRVSGEATNRCYCHCRSCRLASGAPFMAWASFAASRLDLSGVHPKWFRSSDRVERGSCPVCSTTLTYAHDSEPDRVDIALATLDDPSLLAPEFHIWVSNKLPWIAIADGLPQYEEWRPPEDR